MLEHGIYDYNMGRVGKPLRELMRGKKIES